MTEASITRRPHDAAGPIPRPALALGWAGVIPFAACGAAALFGIALPGVEATTALVAYAAIILSFMAGVQWGVEVMRGGSSAAGEAPTAWRGFTASVVPALYAWAALLVLPPRLAIAALAIGFAGLLAYDLARVRAGATPAWYGRLRGQLTAAVVAVLSIVALLAPLG